jgi:hypothetical protein
MRLRTSIMRKIDIDPRRAAEHKDCPLPLPEPIVLGTAATRAVAGGIIRPGLCTTCGLTGRFPVAKVL